MIEIRRILCPIDFSDHSRRALDHAVAIATWFESTITVLNVYPGLEHLLLGSVTEKVIRKARCPVLTVPRGMIDAVPAPPVLFERILCATDFSEASIRALDYALTLAQEADAHLTIMHVVEVTPAPQADVENALESKMLGAYVAAAAADRAGRLKGLIPDTVHTYCTVETKLAIGKPYREILRVASEQRTELIVLGAHGRTISELLFGSTSNQVVRQARCPVLTIR